MEIKNIAVHHTAGNFDTLHSINMSHKQRWIDLPSEMRPDLWIGYNIIIWKNGDWTQCRFIGEETAAQKGHNKDTASICLAGNFSTGLPTDAQKNTLRTLALNIIEQNAYMLSVKRGTVLNIPPQNIFPHRVLQKTTECFGKNLADDWALKTVYPLKEKEVPFVQPQNIYGERMNILRKLIVLYQQLLAQMVQKKSQGCTGENCG